MGHFELTTVGSDGRTVASRINLTARRLATIAGIGCDWEFRQFGQTFVLVHRPSPNGCVTLDGVVGKHQISAGPSVTRSSMLRLRVALQGPRRHRVSSARGWERSAASFDRAAVAGCDYRGKRFDAYSLALEYRLAARCWEFAACAWEDRGRGEDAFRCREEAAASLAVDVDAQLARQAERVAQ